MEERALPQTIAGLRQISNVVHRAYVRVFHHIHGIQCQKHVIAAMRVVIIP